MKSNDDQPSGAPAPQAARAVESEVCRALFASSHSDATTAREAALAFCIEAIYAIPPSHVVFASAIWVIYRDGLHKPRSFPAFASDEFRLKKENAYRHMRYGRLVATLYEKHGPLLWPNAENERTHGPRVWPKLPRLPLSEREARPFAATKYSSAEQVRGWEFATWLIGPKPIPEEKAKSVMGNLARRGQPANVPSLLRWREQAWGRLLKYVLCASQVLTALVSILFAARYGACFSSLSSIGVAVALAGFRLRLSATRSEHFLSELPPQGRAEPTPTAQSKPAPPASRSDLAHHQASRHLTGAGRGRSIGGFSPNRAPPSNSAIAEAIRPRLLQMVRSTPRRDRHVPGAAIASR